MYSLSLTPSSSFHSLTNVPNNSSAVSYGPTHSQLTSAVHAPGVISASILPTRRKQCPWTRLNYSSTDPPIGAIACPSIRHRPWSFEVNSELDITPPCLGIFHSYVTMMNQHIVKRFKIKKNTTIKFMVSINKEVW